MTSLYDSLSVEGSSLRWAQAQLMREQASADLRGDYNAVLWLPLRGRFMMQLENALYDQLEDDL